MDVSHSVLNALPQIDCESDWVRIHLCRCSVAASNKPLPMTNRACHFWLSVRLLVFHMCSGGSFAASEIIICKDEGLSGEAAGLWQQPFHLSLFSATPSLFLLQSFCLSFPPLWLFILVFCLPVPSSLPVSSISLFSPPYFPLLLILSVLLPSCLYFLLFLFSLAHNLWFWCRLSESKA